MRCNKCGKLISFLTYQHKYCLKLSVFLLLKRIQNIEFMNNWPNGAKVKDDRLSGGGPATAFLSCGMALVPSSSSVSLWLALGTSTAGWGYLLASGLRGAEYPDSLCKNKGWIQ